MTEPTANVIASASPTPRVVIAIDAMGGDFAPREIVAGAVQAALVHQVGIQLVGAEAILQAELERLRAEGQLLDALPIEIVPAAEVIDMAESPASALRRKKDASIVVSAKCVAKGTAHAMVAAGSTGAAMAAALLYIGRIDGVERPAIGVVLPSSGAPCLLLDAGANADCIPEMLLQFARMGSVFMQNVYEARHPRVGLLNIGQEVGKGNAFVNACYPLLSADPYLNFIGNVEGRDLFLGTVDVAVCDGFTGNVALKSAEGVVLMFAQHLKAKLTGSWQSKLGAMLARSALVEAKKKVDPDEFGGALLLGINGVCVIAHGGSKAAAIVNAVRVAKNAVEARVLEKIGLRITEGLTHACP
jgi:glycerol-3-phosphate acyltransferase PlsX